MVRIGFWLGVLARRVGPIVAPGGGVSEPAGCGHPGGCGQAMLVRDLRGRVLYMLHLLYLLYRVIGSAGSHLRTVRVRSQRWRGRPGVRLPRGLLG